MPTRTSAENLADNLETFALACDAPRVPMDQVIELANGALLFLNQRYGIGNRHSVAVSEMLTRALAQQHDGQIHVDVLKSIAHRLRRLPDQAELD